MALGANGPLVLPNGTVRAGLVTRRASLDSKRGGLQGKLNVEEMARVFGSRSRRAAEVRVPRGGGRSHGRGRGHGGFDSRQRLDALFQTTTPVGDCPIDIAVEHEGARQTVRMIVGSRQVARQAVTASSNRSSTVSYFRFDQ